MNKVILCNTSSSTVGRSSKSRTEVFYLDKIRELGFEIDRLEVVCTDGDWSPPYPYQWIAKTTVPKGFDDAIEGAGQTPKEALKVLLKECISINY